VRFQDDILQRFDAHARRPHREAVRSTQCQRRLHSPSDERRFEPSGRDPKAGRRLGRRGVEDHFEDTLPEQCREWAGTNDPTGAQHKNA